jgi:hypothetical protein
VTLRRVAVGCGIIVLVALLVVGCGIARVYAELPAGEYPSVDFENQEISAARAAIAPELEAQLEGMERRFGARPLGERIRIDRCERGFDNFEGTTQYAYSCRMTIAELIPVREPFKQEASRLGEALLEGECPDGTDTDRALPEQFSHPRQLDSSTGDCTPGYRVAGPEIRDWLSVAPTIDEIELAEQLLRPSCFREYCDVGPLDLRAAVSGAPAEAAWLAVVQADETYYLVAWECDWPATWFNEICRNESRPLTLAFRTPGEL